MTRRSTTTSSSVHIELDDAAANFLFDQIFQFGGIVRSAARSGHEGAHADVDAQSAFDHAGHRADDRRLLREGFLKRCPVGGALDLAASQLVVAFGIAAFDGDLQFVAGLRRFVGRECAERENTFGLESDIEDDGVGGHGNHRALAALGGWIPLARMALLVLRENVFEGFGGLGNGLGRRLG